MGLSPEFSVHLAAQVLLALGAALMSGAQESWVADETRQAEMTPMYLRATQLRFLGIITGSLFSGALASYRALSADARRAARSWRSARPRSQS